MNKSINDAKDARTRRSRELLRDYVLVLANSGMRIREANNLGIRDVIPFRDDKGRANYPFIVRGKTGKRDVILRSAAASRVDKLLAIRSGEDRDNFLFAIADGSKFRTLITQ